MRKILLIDDELDFCHFVKLNLEKTGCYEVLVATDGPQGLKLAKDQKPDLILLDILMPGMNGSEVAENLLLNNSTKDIPIIFVTAIARKKEVEEHYGNIGGRTFLAKPVTPEELIDNIERILERKEKL